MRFLMCFLRRISLRPLRAGVPLLALLLSVPGMLAAEPVSPAAADKRVLGTWELVEVTVPVIELADPRGIRNVKEFYSDDGFLYVIPADGSLADDTPRVAYSVQGDKRVTRTRNGQSVEAKMSFPNDDTLLLEHRNGDVWRYLRLRGEDANSRAVAPLSVEAVPSKDATREYVPREKYDRKDYSKLALRERLVGTWEKVEMRRVSAPRERPYGFFNDVWRITPGTVTVLFRATGEEGRAISYKLKGDELRMLIPPDDAEFHAKVSFDTFGRLVFDDGRRQEIFVLVAKQAEQPLNVPFRIVLSEAQR